MVRTMLRGRRTSERAAVHQQLLLAQLPSSFVWTTCPNLRLTSAAGAALPLVGVGAPDVVVGQELSAILAGGRDGGAAIIDAHKRALEGESTHLVEASRRWAFDVYIDPLRDDGEIVGVGGIALDASRRQAAERALVESEARFRTLVERLPICTYVNPLGFPIRTTYISPYVEQLLGFPVERWLEEDDFYVSRLHPDDRDRVMEGTTRTHATGEPFRGTYRMIAKDGSVVHLLDETIPVSDDTGRVLFLQGFLLDIGQ
jgi:PAS domain S-box-containing protein